MAFEAYGVTDDEAINNLIQIVVGEIYEYTLFPEYSWEEAVKIIERINAFNEDRYCLALDITKRDFDMLDYGYYKGCEATYGCDW